MDSDRKAPHHAWKPGESGTPGGRARMPAEVKEMLQCATPRAVQRLVEALDAEFVVHYKGEEVGSYVDHSRRLEAVQILLDRLFGRPIQSVAGEDGQPLTIDLGAQLIEAIRKLASDK